ncbi:MAG: flagellar brake protein [Lachnospiraceae bacterium]
MLTEFIRPGDKIEIQAVEQAILGSASNKKAYTSKIYDILDDEQLEILMPMDGTKLILLPVDGEYRFCFYTNKGLYQCFIRITDRYKSNNVYLLLCEVTSPIGKYQRREYYRYACTLPVKTRDLMEEEQKAVEENKFRMQVGLPMAKGQIVDISGGGIRFVTPVSYEVGSLIAICFSLNIHGREIPYELVGEILSNRENEVRRGEFEHRVMFKAIDNKKREEIIRYIFEEERKSRRR